MKNFNPEYFHLNERVVVHDNIFELGTVNGLKKVKTYNGVGISSVDMVDKNLLDGDLINLHIMYQSNWIICPTIFQIMIHIR